MKKKDILRFIHESGRENTLDWLARRVLENGLAADLEAGRKFLMKHEAHARLQAMGIYPAVISEFMRDGTLNRSESGLASLYWLDEAEKKMVRDWEQETGNLVYHVVKAGSEAGDLGVMYSFLYVSRSLEEWYTDREDIETRTPWTYTLCTTYPDNSEYGRIAVQYRFGGVVRVA